MRTQRHNAKYDQTKYPFHHLSVGSYFLVPADRRFSVATLAKVFGDRHGRRFRVLKDPAAPGDFRCTRVR